jgi:hypothetical protein
MHRLKARLLLLLAGLAWLAMAPAARAEVVHFKQLLPLMEISLPGWKMVEKPSGTTVKYQQVQTSQAQASYRSGDQSLEIMIIDFIGNPMAFQALGHKLEVETDTESIRTIEVQGFKALEVFHTQEKRGELSIGVADRFWVKLDGSGIANAAILTTAAQKMDLKKLADLAK